ncbi:MAG: right-handed parallel beta-helix repeat-containing protein [Bacteroidetes bacterium]|nr:right-handed parallel beta-helix repeat-containing protein [Bacteroidota bacterium]
MKYFIIPFLLLIVAYSSVANVIMVSQAQGSKTSSIQVAINSANTGDTVLVSPGTYYEIVDFIGKNITVASNFLMTADTNQINQTIIDGNFTNSALVRFTHGESRSARFVGFTVRHGYAVYIDGTDRLIGLGVHIENASPTIESNKIINNAYEIFDISGNIGGGIGMKNSSALVLNNKIMNNINSQFGGGIEVWESSGATFTGNLIAENSVLAGWGDGVGAGIHLYLSDNIIIKNNIIEKNLTNYGSGDGIFSRDCENLLIISNIIRNGNGDAGVNLLTSSGKFINNLVYNDAYLVNQLVYIDQSNFSVINSTLANNNSTSLQMSFSMVEVINSILYGEDDGISNNQVAMNGGSASFKFCDIEGGTESFNIFNATYTSTHTITSDPLFTGDENNPYSLAWDSPCSNEGNPDTTALWLPQNDLAGYPRIIQWIVDIGAYENQLYDGFPTLKDESIFTLYPNPATNYLEISLSKLSSQNKELKVYSTCGSLMLEKQFRNTARIDVGQFPKGIYVALVYFEGKTYNQQFVVN